MSDEKWWEGEGAPGEEPGVSEDLFSKLDTDGDGVVTRDEFENVMEQEPTLTGEVSTIMVDDGSGMGPLGDGGSVGGLSDSMWFVIGLIGAPVALGVLSLIFTIISASLYEDGWFYGEDNSLSTEGTVRLSSEDYNQYRANFYGIPDDARWYSTTLDWEGLPTMADWGVCWVDTEWDDHDVIDGDEGREWHSMQCDGNTGGEVYVSLWGGTVNYASKRGDVPDAAQIDGEGAGVASREGTADALGFLGAAVWPIGLVAGMVWGFTKGSSSFAYGMLASVVVVPLVLFGLCVIMIVVMIGSGGGF